MSVDDIPDDFFASALAPAVLRVTTTTTTTRTTTTSLTTVVRTADADTRAETRDTYAHPRAERERIVTTTSQSTTTTTTSRRRTKTTYLVPPSYFDAARRRPPAYTTTTSSEHASSESDATASHTSTKTTDAATTVTPPPSYYNPAYISPYLLKYTSVVYLPIKPSTFNKQHYQAVKAVAEANFLSAAAVTAPPPPSPPPPPPTKPDETQHDDNQPRYFLTNAHKPAANPHLNPFANRCFNVDAKTGRPTCPPDTLVQDTFSKSLTCSYCGLENVPSMLLEDEGGQEREFDEDRERDQHRQARHEAKNGRDETNRLVAYFMQQARKEGINKKADDEILVRHWRRELTEQLMEAWTRVCSRSYPEPIGHAAVELLVLLSEKKNCKVTNNYPYCTQWYAAAINIVVNSISVSDNELKFVNDIWFLVHELMKEYMVNNEVASPTTRLTQLLKCIRTIELVAPAQYTRRTDAELFWQSVASCIRHYCLVSDISIRAEHLEYARKKMLAFQMYKRQYNIAANEKKAAFLSLKKNEEAYDKDKSVLPHDAKPIGKSTAFVMAAGLFYHINSDRKVWMVKKQKDGTEKRVEAKVSLDWVASDAITGACRLSIQGIHQHLLRCD